MSDPPPETGDRLGFLAAVRARQGPPPAAGPHPPPPAPEVVPEVRYRSLDGVEPDDVDALVEVFVAAAEAAECTVAVVPELEVAVEVRRVAVHWGVRSAVHSNEPEASSAAARLRSVGIAVSPYTPQAAASADLSVTSATHGLASTGTVVVDSATAGSRAVSLLAPRHVCVLPAKAIVPTHADVLRDPDRPMPSCRVLVTGPSRTGDIEQRLTLGAHGPVALHVVVATTSPPDESPVDS
jgi:L-lactate dehydrogenase complex protein LldG